MNDAEVETKETQFINALSRHPEISLRYRSNEHCAVNILEQVVRWKNILVRASRQINPKSKVVNQQEARQALIKANAKDAVGQILTSYAYSNLMLDDFRKMIDK